MKTQISSKNMFGKVISACLLQIIALNSYLSSCFIQILIEHILNNLKCIWEHFFSVKHATNYLLLDWKWR